jgi:O-antigen/teichoic acid export membrane protein
MTGHERWTALGAGLGVALNAGIAALLIPRWGVEGAGLAYILSTIFYKLFGALAIYRTTGVLAWFGARGQDGTSGG